MEPGNADKRLRFDGRVAIVTGSGGRQPNLGSAYAKFLAARGARVVLNRLGIGPYGDGRLSSSPHEVVDEIRSAGGEAVIATQSVAEREGASAVVQAALDQWQRVDILVNNAGVIKFGTLDELPEDDIRRIIDTHLYGHLWMSRAVWPHMRAANYGRIVNISSVAAFGFPQVAAYGAAKAGVAGLASNLALEGQPYDITVNTVCPEAATRKHGHLFSKAEPDSWTAGKEREVEQVAPVVAFFCHESCDVTGGHFVAKGGRVSEYVTCETRGFERADLSIEDVAANMASIRNRTNLQPMDRPAAGKMRTR